MRIDKATIERWEKYATLYLHERGLWLADVKDKGQAWQIAFALRIPGEAYHIDGKINDSHIETALRRIFPNMER